MKLLYFTILSVFTASCMHTRQSVENGMNMSIQVRRISENKFTVIVLNKTDHDVLLEVPLNGISYGIFYEHINGVPCHAGGIRTSTPFPSLVSFHLLRKCELSTGHLPWSVYSFTASLPDDFKELYTFHTCIRFVPLNNSCIANADEFEKILYECSTSFETNEI